MTNSSNNIEISDEEKKIIGVIRSLEKRPKDPQTGEIKINEEMKIKPTKEGIIAFGNLRFKNQTDNWSILLDSLVQKKLLLLDGTLLSLTDTGRDMGTKILTQWTSKWYGDILLRSAESKAYALFCERVFGRNLCQFNVLDMEQLGTMLERMKLQPNDYVLDLGCGLGGIAEYISDNTGARVLGIDFAKEAVNWAQQQTQSKRDRLSFQIGDINNLNFPPSTFNAIISIDSLYLVDDLESLIKKLSGLLKSRGQLGIFMAQFRNPEEPIEVLKPENTKLAKALKRNGFLFETIDFTENSRNIWIKELAATKDLREMFEEEGNLDLCEDRIADSKQTMSRIDNQLQRRYFYHAKKK